MLSTPPPTTNPPVGRGAESLWDLVSREDSPYVIGFAVLLGIVFPTIVFAIRGVHIYLHADDQDDGDNKRS